MASFCFPNGAKICYTKEEGKLTPYPNYFTLITNELGDRYYLSVTHYYIKVDLITFKNSYDFDPVKDFFKLGKLEELSNPNQTNQQNQNEIDLCFSFMDNDFIYLPFAACMISKYPYIKQMEKCLESILKLTVDQNNSDELNKFIKHLVHEIPIPPLTKRLMFYIPYQITPLEIYNSVNELPIFSNNLFSLFNFFSFENIMLIHMLMLFEQKIIFIHNDYKVLTEISQAFTTILFPLIWTHTYIPILTEDTLMIVLTFLPYIIGIEESMFGNVSKLLECNKDEENNIFFVYIKKNVIELYSNGQMKRMKKKMLVQFIPEYPEGIYNELVQGLKEIKKNDSHKLISKSNKKILGLFVKAMVYLFGDHKKYVSVIDGIPLLNTTSFLQKRAEKTHKFYKEFTGTQLFRYFLQNKENSYFEKMCIRYNCQGRERSNSFRMTIGKATPGKRSSFIKTPNPSAQKLTISALSASKEINKSSEVAETYIITQFFTQDPVVRLEPVKLEEFLSMKYKGIRILKNRFE
jgi:hypothetical protein